LHSPRSNFSDQDLRFNQYVVGRNLLSPQPIREEDIGFTEQLDHGTANMNNKISSDEWMQMRHHRDSNKTSGNTDKEAIQTRYYGETVIKPLNTQPKPRRHYEPIEL